MKKSNKPLREAFSVNWRGLRLWHQNCPQIIWSAVVSIGIRSIAPYVTIWFSARIIDELTGNRDPQRLWQLVLLTVSVTGLMTLLGILVIILQLTGVMTDAPVQVEQLAGRLAMLLG